ncbi:Choline dehydrogenase, mitochondrial [Orchesella cincta]|uniref:Choline dehydrogenase, mitochondrial n=1 Tax=Orchesella cincta TaxID=48709 RepID=A0A1D2MZY7_ORCCI|nr:Choline dehydrogenase, mitochondrial [Orchesella cincta]
MKAMIEGVSLLLKLYHNTTSMQRINAGIPRAYPECPQNVPLDSPASIECVIRTFTLTLYHPSSTCAMGKAEDPNSVVDSQLR